MEIVRQDTPEQRELRKKRSELNSVQTTLSERELELATVRAELAAFEERYVRSLGSRYAELDAIEAQIAEAAARTNPADRDAQTKAADAKIHASESARLAEESSRKIPQADFQASDSLKKLYREAAKVMHPDLADNDDDRSHRHGFMIRANAAYESGDAEKLSAILQEWQSSPESVKGDDLGAELVRIIRKIARCEERIQAIGVAIEQIAASDLALLKTKAEEASNNGRDLFAEMASRIEGEIARARVRLGSLKQDGKGHQ